MQTGPEVVLVIIGPRTTTTIETKLNPLDQREAAIRRLVRIIVIIVAATIATIMVTTERRADAITMPMTKTSTI